MFRPNSNQNSPESSEYGPQGGNWADSPSPCTTPSRPLLGNHSHRSLSHNSRIQAIVRGQKELMEMVKNMPESSYELSLKDLVENDQDVPVTPPPPKGSSNNNSDKMLCGGKGKREGGQKGVFLKMGLPIKRSSNGKGGGGSTSVGERDWWKKKFSGSSGSDMSSKGSNASSSTRSSSSGSSSSSYVVSGR